MPRKYDIEADWTLMTTCNFRCVYCFHSDRMLGAKINPPAPAKKLADILRQLRIALAPPSDRWRAISLSRTFWSFASG